MKKILVPVDGSENASRVVRHVLTLAGELREPLDIHLLNVQHPFPGTIKGVAEQARQYHQEQGEAALADARKLLDDAKVKYSYHVSVGEAAPTVAKFAGELQCDLVIMGTRGMGSLANMVMGSVATKVLHLVHVPVMLVK